MAEQPRSRDFCRGKSASILSFRFPNQPVLFSFQMKDFLGLLHLYLAKRELQTRKVKSKSFAGIDVKELDLIHPPPHSNGVFF